HLGEQVAAAGARAGIGEADCPGPRRLPTFARRGPRGDPVKQLWRDAIGDPSPIPWAGARRVLHALVLAAATTFAALALLRWHTFHNETFDLAFYARMAWGEAHLDAWNPIVNAHARGLHLAWILVPL